MTMPLPDAAQGGATPKLAMIDIAKGIGICLIVLGHNEMFTYVFSDFSDFLKSFRLPFFFFIAGVTFSAGKRSLGALMLQRADAWLKPWLVAVVMLGLLRMYFQHWPIERLLLGLTFATGFTLRPVAVWFLPHLWLLYVFCTWLLNLHRQLWANAISGFILLLALLVGGYFFLGLFDDASVVAACRGHAAFAWSLFDCGLPFSADLLFLTAFYFLLGNFLSSRVKSFRVNRAASLAAAAVMLLCQYYFDYSIDFNLRRYDDLIVTTVQALAGIYLMLCLCIFLTKMAPLATAFRYLGQASLFILLFHVDIMEVGTAWLSPVMRSAGVVCVISVATAIVVPWIGWQLCKRNPWASLLFLPITRHAPQRCPVPGAQPG